MVLLPEAQLFSQRPAPSSATRATIARNRVGRCRGFDPTARGREHLVPLPDGAGFLLPCTNDLFGPGYAFRMTASSTHSNDTSSGIVLYQPPQPPIVSDKNRSEARVIVYHGRVDQTNFEQWEERVHESVGLLPQPEIAGVLPSPSDEAEGAQVLIHAIPQCVCRRARVLL